MGACVLVSIAGCKNKESASSPADSMAQQIGDAMVSIDEAGGSDGGYAFLKREQKIIARYSRVSAVQALMDELVPRADAASCLVTNTWGNCLSNVVVRDFQGCAYLGATFSGTITYSFSDATVDNTCSISANGHYVTRHPSFTITGSQGAAFAVSKTGTNGQKIERTGAAAYNFTNDGIRRILTYGGTTWADFTTTTTSAIGISGANRSGRTANGGALRVSNNLTGVTCDFAPSGVTWGSTCNCATSGNWSASCSNGASASLAITGCGTGTFVFAGESSSVVMDQCGTL